MLELKPHSLKLNQIECSSKGLQPGLLYFCSSSPVAEGPSESGPALRPEVPWRPFTELMDLLPISLSFYHFLSCRMVILDLEVNLAQGAFNDVCCDHIQCLCLLLIPGTEWLRTYCLICCNISKRPYVLSCSHFSFPLHRRIFYFLQCF